MNRSSTASDISDILNSDNPLTPESMMLSSKKPRSGSNHKKSHSKSLNKATHPLAFHSDDEDDQVINDSNVPYHLEQYKNASNVNSKYGHVVDDDDNNDYFKPFVGGGSPPSFDGDLKEETDIFTAHEKCMRRILQLTFSICIIFFISPLIFFIFGASEIIAEYARVAKAVRESEDVDDTKIKDIAHFPTANEICTANAHDCARYVFFLIYMIIFIIMFVCCISLFAIRKQKHPLKSRSCTFITIFCLSLPFYVIWACVGLMYAPSWLGCHLSHTFNNIMYPLLILPYFFRAYRIKKIYDEATTNYGQYNRDLNIFRSARTQSVISVNFNYNEQHSSNEHPSNSIKQMKRKNSASGMSDANASSFNIENAMTLSKQLEKRLIKYFILSLIPFILMSIINYLPFVNYHLLPTFIKSCDEYYASSSIAIWALIHAFEIFLLILIVYWIRLVWRAFSVKQELMIVAVIDMVFCACMVGFSPTTNNIDDGVMVLYLILMRGIGFFMITILLPLYKTYFIQSYLPEIPTQDVITSLDAILEDMDACVFFRQFMTEQDSQHLLDFWMEIDLFKDACYNDEIDDIRFAASKIFKKYFDLNNYTKQATSIRYIVNCREKTKDKNKNFVKAISKIFDEKNQRKIEIHPNIFDHPHRVIFEHMENIHYRLFLRSQYCKQLLSSVAGQEEIFRKLINQEIL